MYFFIIKEYLNANLSVNKRRKCAILKILLLVFKLNNSKKRHRYEKDIKSDFEHIMPLTRYNEILKFNLWDNGDCICAQNSG